MTDRRQFAAALALFAAGIASTSALAQAPAAGRARVVIQVSDNDPAKWNLALNNARNLQEDLGAANLDIEVVAYGPGLAMLRDDSTVADRLAQALDKNVTLLACENTMRNQKVARSDIYAGVKFVNAGVVHLMKRQREGWSYIRP